MALGSARLFNIKLTRNFNSPYLATSVIDFWRRWHISFSRWILDYIFKPLQIQWRNWNNLGTAGALIATFLISGIWHGASWGFVIWGGLHGLYMGCSVFYKPYQKKLHDALRIERTEFLKFCQIFVTFNLVSLAWVFFRASNFADAMYVVTNMLKGIYGVRYFISSTGKFNILAVAISLVIFIVVSYNVTKFNFLFQNKPLFRWILYYALLFTILSLGKFGESSFLYFKF